MIDPSAFIAPGAVVLGDVALGPGASVWYNSVVRGDAERIEIGEGSNIQDLSMLHADPGVPCVVGRRVTVGHRAILHGCTVEDDCLIGMGAILLNGVTIGAGSVVGAGALLTEGTEVPPGSLVLGMPEKVVRPVGESMRARIDHAWRHYVEEARRHRSGEVPPHPPTPPPDAGESVRSNATATRCSRPQGELDEVPGPDPAAGLRPPPRRDRGRPGGGPHRPGGPPRPRHARRGRVGRPGGY
ncbi:gamma carbonic anhydrase family protein [Tautonia plasticadhaerens]|uniref:2,3,4,5-tetrahydropyridine-2,6-dicarboxylate N-acetyltransferase n=1 Tax=Tautonia plasticadhaerens TaxID=2527974 RepID=A0A518GVH1_9BACT|nr:gamma carbonic anhydrase family protein [Tautonia plasticadhaerens]QDV32595.1 2,3,4,5-tetrahydropyridine-2,6-dicarboxylate N-acetyltransferase [Tautonia plasticadhaerens]